MAVISSIHRDRIGILTSPTLTKFSTKGSGGNVLGRPPMSTEPEVFEEK